MNAIKKWFKSLRTSKRNGDVPQYLYRSGSNWEVGMDSGVTGSYMSINDIVTSNVAYSDSGSPKQAKKDERLEKKPVEVWQEIIASEKPTFGTTDIDSQIKIVKRRLDMLKELGGQTGDEVEALRFLEARRKFVKKQVDFPWPIATFEGIKKLCEKYKLAYVDFGSYSKTIPMEAIDELEKFMSLYSIYVGEDKPILKLIIDDIPTKEHGGRSAERKKDPILLASSPFGKWFHILGAWDKEVQIVDDLVYHNK